MAAQLAGAARRRRRRASAWRRASAPAGCSARPAPRWSAARRRRCSSPASRERFDHVWRPSATAAATPGRSRLAAPGAVDEVARHGDRGVLPSPPPGHPRDRPSPAGCRARRRFAARRATGARARRPRASARCSSCWPAGATDGQIADMLELSPATVQTHVRNAKAKLGARTRAQAVAMALQRGMIATSARARRPRARASAGHPEAPRKRLDLRLERVELEREQRSPRRAAARVAVRVELGEQVVGGPFLGAHVGGVARRRRGRARRSPAARAIAPSASSGVVAQRVEPLGAIEVVVGARRGRPASSRRRCRRSARRATGAPC